MIKLCFRLAILLFLISLFCSYSCGARRDQKREFNKVLEAYHNKIRMKNVEGASAFVSGELRTDFYPLVEKMLENSSVSGFRIRSVTMNEARDFATVVIIREIYKEDSLVVKSETITQEWKKVDKKKWILVGGGF